MLKKLNDKIGRTYSDEKNNIVKEFYEPVLQNSIRYDRITGDFSSSSLAAATIGFSHFFFNNGRMRLLCNFKIGDEILFEALKKYESNSKVPEEIEEIILNSISLFQDALEDVKKRIDILTWLLKESRLEIRFVLRFKDWTMYHKKVAIFEDEVGDKIGIIGSLNESWTAYKGNGEVFQVHKSWVPEQDKYVDDDIELFNDDWALKKRKSSITFNITESIKHGILNTLRDRSKEEIEPTLDEEIPGSQDIDEAGEEKGEGGCSGQKENETEDLKLYPLATVKWKVPPQTVSYQEWLNNGKHGILSIATGVGKTLIAIRAIFEFFQEQKKESDVDRIVTIAVHNKDMIGQWNDDILTWLTNRKTERTIRDIVMIKGITKKDIATQAANFETSFLNCSAEVILIAWYQTFAREIIPVLLKYQEKKIVLFIADEVHEMGTQARIEYFKEFEPNFRMGLSATPKRYFDMEGTSFILDYFKGKKDDGIIYEYDIADAIRDKHLSPYEYWPIFCQLSADEREEYNMYSRMIAIEQGKPRKDEEKIFGLLMNRKLILNKAKMKIDTIVDLMKTIRRMTGNGLKYVLIYLEDTTDLLTLYRKLNDNDFNPKYIIKDTKEREKIIMEFRTGSYPILLAIDILDQGINIPELRIGIISSSTGNEKQYVQRRGRLLRNDKKSGKEKAIIYDLVIPIIQDKDKKKYISSEIFRANIFISDSQNKETVIEEFETYCDDTWEEIESNANEKRGV